MGRCCAHALPKELWRERGGDSAGDGPDPQRLGMTAMCAAASARSTEVGEDTYPTCRPGIGPRPSETPLAWDVAANPNQYRRIWQRSDRFGSNQWKHRRRACLARLFPVLMRLLFSGLVEEVSMPPYFGVCYSPYHRTNKEPPHDVSAEEVGADMAIIKSRKLTHIRTYSAASGNRHNVGKAAEHGLQVGLGIWIDNNVPNNGLIDEALTQALDAASAYPDRHTVVDLVIGNEVNRTDDKAPLDPVVILNYIVTAQPP